MNSLKKSWEKGLNKVLLDCDTATLLITKQSLASVSCVEQVQLRMHLTICVFCRSFKEQTEFITRQMKQWAQIDPDNLILSLSDEQKKTMKEHLRSAGASV